jgi:hypothetical protein
MPQRYYLLLTRFDLLLTRILLNLKLVFMKQTNPGFRRLKLNKKTIVNLNGQFRDFLAGNQAAAVHTFTPLTSFSAKSCGDPMCNTASVETICLTR